MKHAAGELPLAALLDVQHRARQPARADDAIRLADVLHQIVKRVRRRGAVGVHVADQVRQRRQLESFDERAALADGLREFQRADRRIIRADALHDAERVVRAAVEHDDELELAVVMLLEIAGIVAQHRFDAALFVVSRDQEQQAVARSRRLLTRERPKGNGVVVSRQGAAWTWILRTYAKWAMINGPCRQSQDGAQVHYETRATSLGIRNPAIGLVAGGGVAAVLIGCASTDTARKTPTLRDDFMEYRADRGAVHGPGGYDDARRWTRCPCRQIGTRARPTRRSRRPCTGSRWTRSKSAPARRPCAPGAMPTSSIGRNTWRA